MERKDGGCILGDMDGNPEGSFRKGNLHGRIHGMPPGIMVLDIDDEQESGPVFHAGSIPERFPVGRH